MGVLGQKYGALGQLRPAAAADGPRAGRDACDDLGEHCLADGLTGSGIPDFKFVLYLGRHADGWIESKQCVAANLDRPISGANLDPWYPVGDDWGRGLLWLHVGRLAVSIACDLALCDGHSRKNSG